MNLFAIGVLLVIAGGALEGLFSLPVTRTKDWQWENIWGVGSLIALILVPWPVALLTVPNLFEVYGQVAPSVLIWTFLFGLGWGLGGIFWGKAIAALGMAMGISLLMGLLNVFGSPVPLAYTKGIATLATPGGLTLLAAVAVMVLGVVVCAVAGARKEKELGAGDSDSDQSRPSTPFTVGLTFCVLSAVLSAMVNFGFISGEPISKQADDAIRASAGEPSRAEAKKAKGDDKEPPVNFLANNALWALVFTGNYAVNAIYAFFLMWKNKTAGLIFSKGRPSYWAWALFMGIAWPLGIVLFGMGSNYMGEFGPFVAFPMMLVMAILFGNLAGALTGEWKGTSGRPRLIMVAGVAILVGAFAVFGWANRWLGAAPADDSAAQSSVNPQSAASPNPELPSKESL